MKPLKLGAKINPSFLSVVYLRCFVAVIKSYIGTLWEVPTLALFKGWSSR
jgi:hypothetical protein